MSRACVRGLIATVVLGSIAVGCGGGGAAKTAAKTPCPTSAQPSIAAKTRDAPPRVPTHGAYFGAFALTGDFSQPSYVASVAQLQTEICRPLAIVHSYLRWKQKFPQQSQLTASRAGQTLLLSWTGTNLAEMASGADDAEIREIAGEVAALHSPVFVELRWEMDRPNLRTIVGSPTTFIAAWDHTRAVFAAAGVSNASWVWCPTAVGFDDDSAPAYYPGAKEVDWICTDAYPKPDGPVEQLSSELASFLKWAVPQRKPIMLGEIGVPESYNASKRTGWIDNAADLVKDTPLIKAVVYFDYNPEDHPATRDYRIEPSSPAAGALRSLAADPWFQPTFGR
ncbi:MAG TPA: hypothetical protein VHV79_05035 [Mycobacteriales bacterium]|nr:hypothetical protein [Mycobacteriales bacterium]